MTQITFRLRTANAGNEGDALLTTQVQQLPQWAPPIEYIADNTTSDFNAFFIGASTTNDVPVIRHNVRVFAYGRSPTIRRGREIVSLSIPVGEHSITRTKMLTLRYRAVGEIVRP